MNELEKKNNSYVINVKNTIFQISVIFVLDVLIFQNLIEKYIKIIKYFDETIAVIGIIAIYIYIIKKDFRIPKNDFVIMNGIIVITIIGFFSIFSYRLQELKYAMVDWIIFIKFFSAYFLGKIIKKSFSLNKKLISRNIQIIIIILFLFSIANYIFDLYPGEIRYGLKSNKIFYGHPTYLAVVCIALLSINIKYTKKVFSFYNIVTLLLLLSTLRFKSIGAAIVCFVIAVYIDMTGKKITFTKLGIAGLLVIFVTFQQIEAYYFTKNENARNELTRTSITIAKEYFPIGTGFGTYGSYASAKKYSAVYYKYGLNNVWGLSKDFNAFITDTFWPMIIGQFGILGCATYIICLIYIFKNIQEGYSYTKDKYVYLACLISLVYLLISSSSETAFANSFASLLALIIGGENEK